MNFFDHKNLGNHLLQLRPKVVKHPAYFDVFPVNTSNNLRILDFMLDLLVMRQAELQSIITIAISL
jgi:hypothetical protein